MKITRGYKTELDLTNKQKSACIEHAGAARFAYNWALDRKKEAHSNGEKAPSAYALHRKLNALKKTEFPWLYRVSKCAPQEALRNADRAYDTFFRKILLKKKGKYKGKTGFPTYKKRTRAIGSFRLTGTIRVTGKTIRLPRLGILRLKEKGYLPGNTHILSAAVSEQAGRFFVSLQTEETLPVPDTTKTGAIGLDLGIKTLATLSDRTLFKNPRPLKSALGRLRRLQRSLSRKRKGSRNREKTKKKLAVLHFSIANIRKDAIHKLTSNVCKSHAFIAIEDLNVGGMLKNHHLAQAISDAGFGEIRRQLTYKALWYNTRLVVIDRFFPSSKTCSVCGYIYSALSLAERQWTCPACEVLHMRDENAARTILLAASSAERINACGAESADNPVTDGETMPRLKQEPNTL